MSQTKIEANFPSPLQKFRLPHWTHEAPEVWVKRDDLIHEIVSGNKWRKLAYANVVEHSHIVSIGGGFSNHLHALGYMCHINNIAFTALVRGNYQANPTPMLKDLKAWDASVQYITKQHYATRDTQAFSHWLDEHFSGAHFIPEGGSSLIAIKGIGDMMREINNQSIEACGETPELIVAPVASGATLAGMITHATIRQDILGIAVLKGEDYLHQQVCRFLKNDYFNWSINHNFVGKGYAKSTPELHAFCRSITQQLDLPLEPVYSGKTFYALNHMITHSQLTKYKKIVLLHTGGMQGARIN